MTVSRGRSEEAGWSSGKLSAEPRQLSAARPLKPGTHEISGARGEPFRLLVPEDLDPKTPASLVVLLHGAGATPRDVLPLLDRPAEEAKLLLLAPKSEGPTWDLLLRSFGPDVAMLDAALQSVFDGFLVDDSRIAIAGFSDGASYALSLGLVNGILFSDVLAFSPGFMAPESLADKPRIFISHGTEDRVLPIERCSRTIAPQLQSLGYDVAYHEFNGGHVVPRETIEAALSRFLGTGASESPSKANERKPSS